MNRNIKHLMASLFDDMLLYSMEYEDQYDDSYKNARWINGDKEDSNCLIHTVIREGPYNYISNKKVAILEYLSNQYFVITPIRKIKESPYFLYEVDPTPGLSTVVFYELNLPIKNNLPNDYVFNLLASQYDAVPDYKGHDIEDIKSIYDEFQIYRVDPNIRINSQEIFRFTGSILCKNPSNLSLNLEPDTLEEFDNSFLFGANNIPHENLLNSILSTSYKHAFIELYQCLEKLYQVFYIEDLYDSIKPSITFIQFLKEIELSLAWKPNEANSMEKIFSSTPKHVYSELVSLKDGNNISKWFYNIRNHLVHLKALQERVDFNSKEWNILLRGSLRIIQHWYTHFDRKLNR